MDNEIFVAEINKMDLIHLRNFEFTHREEIKNLVGYRINASGAMLAEQEDQLLDKPCPMDRELLNLGLGLINLGWGMTSYDQLREKNPHFAGFMADKWEVKADQAKLNGNLLEMVRALDISLFFDPTRNAHSCYLVELFAKEQALEELDREARFVYYYLVKKHGDDHGKLAGFGADMWGRIQKIGMQAAPDNPLFKDEHLKLLSQHEAQPLSEQNENLIANVLTKCLTNIVENPLTPESNTEAVIQATKKLNLLKPAKNPKFEVGKPWQSTDEAMAVHICDKTLFEKRCFDEVDKDNKQQLSLLAGIASKKRLPFIREAVFTELKLIGAEQPNFHAATEIILDTLYAQCLSGMPACLPPLLMHGSAGVGKTRYVKRIAKALGLPCCDISLSGNSDAFKITGLSRYWGTAGPGSIATTFANTEIANPVFLLDEIDKSHKSENGDPLSRILLLLEKETATTFKDDFIDVPIDVSYASYLATCNKIDELSAPLLSRFICVNIEPLDYNGRCIFVSTVYRELRAQEKYGAFFTDDLSQDTLRALAECEEMTGRELKRVVLQGMQRACREIVFGNKPVKSVELEVNDLQLPTKNQAGKKMGFMS